jgi:hypothetical protein
MKMSNISPNPSQNEESVCTAHSEEQPQRNSRSQQQQFKYYLYYISNNSIREIKKTTFAKIQHGKVIVKENARIKIVGDSGFGKAVQNLKSFKPQSLTHIFNGIKGVFAGLNVLGRVTMFVENLATSEKYKRFLLDITTLILNIYRFFEKSLDITGLVVMLIDLYKTWIGVQDIWVPNSLDALFFSSLSIFLPNKLFEIIKRINVFSNVRLLDDPSFFYNLIYNVFDYLKEFILFINIGCISSTLLPLLDVVSNKVNYVKLKNTANLVANLKRDPKIAMKLSLRTQFYVDYHELKSSASLLEWSRRSATVKSYFDELEVGFKILKSYDNAFRVEPSCFIFEGKPGVFKSVYMNNLIEVLGQPCYYHSIKASQDGKDWYDSYNYEPLFCMDDMGAQGISQWRTVVNMVSPVKLPLDCAEASLKDTKFFCSENILISTNNFVNLSGLTKTDCISDIHALWRRGYVFKFDVERQGNMLSGSINFQYFNTQQGAFILGFPSDVLNYCKQQQLFIPASVKITYQDLHQKKKILAWMYDVVTTFNIVKRAQKSANQVNVAEVLQLSQVHRIMPMNPNSDVESLSGISRLSYDDRDLIDHMLGDLQDSVSDDDTASEMESILSEAIDYQSISQPVEYQPPLDDEVFAAYERLTQPDIEVSYWKDFVRDIKHHLSISWETLQQNPTHALFIVVLLLLALGLGIMSSKCMTKQKQAVSMYPQSNLHPSLGAISRQIFDADFYVKDINGKSSIVKNYVLASGHSLVTVAHPFAQVEGEVTVVIYKDRLKNCRIIDMLSFRIVYISLKEDTCVLQCKSNIPMPLSNLSKHFKVQQVDRQVLVRDGFLLLANESYKLDTIKRDLKEPIFYQIPGKFQNRVEDPLLYEYEKIGTCGSVVADSFQGIVGLHVSGSSIRNLGAAIVWSNDVKENILKILKEDNKYILDVNISDKVIPNFSGMKLDHKMFLSTPKTNNIKPTEFNGEFENHKEPVDMLKYGKHTAKTISKKSFQPLVPVDKEELEFAKKVLRVIVEPFGDLTEKEIVAGDEMLAGLNKDSSNGFNCDVDKEKYIDFENKCFTPLFYQELIDLQERIKAGTLELKDILWTETLKEETRALSKEKEPRSFRISRLHIQVLTKWVAGDLARNIMKTRDFNGIAIGVNPIQKWPEYYNELIKCAGKHWATDIAHWDGSMLSEVQFAVNQVLEEKYQGEHQVVLDFLLSSLVYCLVGVNDDLFLTNHSMPTGSFLTALYNSLVHKGYTAMWYFRNVPNATVTGFFRDVFDVVLGDDKLIGVRNETLTQLNALTMTSFFQSIGLDCTTSTKKPVTEPYDKMQDLTFLKRSFEYHPKLTQIVCPLDLKTIMSSIQWYDNKKEYQTVLTDKIHCYQREAYLHYALYPQLMAKLLEAANKHDINVQVLPESYLLYLYKNEPEEAKLLSYSNYKYN